MGNSYSQIIIHLIFSTKNREPLIKLEIMQQLQVFIAKAAKKHQMTVLAVGGIEDHLHSLLIIPPKLSVSRAAQLIKGSSSRWMNKHFFNLEKFRWQRGYGAFSINKSLVPTTIRYIQNQEQHHKKSSYKDEFTAILDRHDISYDDEQLFDSSYKGND